MSERGVGNSVRKKSSRPKVTSNSNTNAKPASPLEIDKGLIAYYPFNGNAKMKIVLMILMVRMILLRY